MRSSFDTKDLLFQNVRLKQLTSSNNFERGLHHTVA